MNSPANRAEKYQKSSDEDTIRTMIGHFRSSNTARRSVRKQDNVSSDEMLSPFADRWKATVLSSRDTSMCSTPLRQHMTFYKISRIVLLMYRVCRTLKECVLESIDGEYWYEPIKKSCRQSKDDSAFSEQSGRKHRPFVTFLANEKTKEIVQLTFDKTLFSRNHTADYFLTDEIRKVLQIAPANRNSEQNLELTRFMKRACNAFQQYPYSIQRQLAQFMVYDRYMPNRMVVKEGLMADGMYFVLSGYLYGKDSETKDMVEVKPGDGYGEEDIKCGCTRRATLVTPEIVELVAIHQKDYRNIFNMSVDTSDARCLDICKRHIVFQHFPMRLLNENPDVWTVLSYKFGRLMVKDSNNMEWIYIIKSGEAKVIRHLKSKMWDPEQRRKNIAKQTAAKDKYHQTLKRIAFIAQGDHIKSHYRRGQYNPAEVQPRTASAPPTLTHPSVNSSCPTTPVKATRSMSHQYRASTPRVTKKTRCIENVDMLCDPSKRNPVSAFDEDVGKPILNLDRGKKTIGFIRTPMLPSLNERAKSGSSTRKDPNLVALPRFVELESLHTGAIFGLRSCLVPEERGPSASLVSGGCQVIQISKKFFLAHADEAIYSLIKFKTKVFPEEEELLDRLNANYEWQEYKKQAMTKFLRMSSKYGSSYKYDLTVLG